MIGKFVSGLFQSLPRQPLSVFSIKHFGTLFNAAPATAINGGTWSLVPVRTRIRYNFPIARETKRIKVHGWKTRMSTPQGRRILMRRILKGRHILSH